MRTRLAFAATLAILGAAAASAQAVPSAPDLIVSVREDRHGADLVTISAAKSDYPVDLLRSQIVALGERLGGARGVAVVRDTFRPGDPSATIVKGSCGVDGLIDGTGRLAIAPIAQAFAGAPEPFTVRRLIVSFDNVTPTNRTLVSKTFGDKSDLAFSGRLVGSSIEYVVELRSQDPTRLVVNEPTGSAKPPIASQKRGTDPLTIALFAAAVLAAGALVYCLLLLLGRRSPSRP
jgi:hypothetical protein